MSPKLSTKPPSDSSAAAQARKAKTGRQQFSSCGACRMRRVKCDLKDHYDTAIAAGVPPSCSDCRDRGLNCIDEFANVRSVKMHRRGRRIQQVEAVYGAGAMGSSSDPGPSSFQSLSPVLITVPPLKPSFFLSVFYKRFNLHRPILDPQEFATRYMAYHDGNSNSLGPAGVLISILLVIWAASFGIDEFGIVNTENNYEVCRHRKLLCDKWIKEALNFVDGHGLLRKPTFDSVRALLLLLPLSKDVLTPLDQLTLYETTLTQAQILCNLESGSVLDPGQEGSNSDVIRARVYWYIYVHDGITAGMHGGRVNMSQECLEAFHQSLNIQNPDLRVAVESYTLPGVSASVPIKVSAVCRLFHTYVTGPKARKDRSLCEPKLKEAWDGLQSCWDELDKHLRSTPGNELEDVEIFVNSWKIFIYECHNIARQALKQRLAALENEMNSSQPNRRETICRLHSVAEFHCRGRLPDILQIIRTSELIFDTSLTRDGVLFAASLIAEGNGTEQDLSLCINTLRQYRWAYSKSEEREATLESMRQSRNSKIPNATSLHTVLAPNRITPPRMRQNSTSASSHNAPAPQTQKRSPRNPSPVSPVSVTIDSYDSDDGSVHNATKQPYTRSPSAHGSTTNSDTSSSYRTQTSHERSAPPLEQNVSPMGRSTPTHCSGPRSFHKILN